MSTTTKNASKRYPKLMRGSPEDVARWEEMTRNGIYDLTEQEVFWRDIQPFLLERGYALRPRYAPDWKPSWIGTNINPSFVEDGASSVPTWVMDARRPDGSTVAIKWIPDAPHTSNEMDIVRYLSSDELRADPRNHSLPLLDTFSHPTIPNGVFAVTPWLAPISNAPLEYVNEVADFMLQTFEGLSFLHAHGVAHRDCTTRNIMVDINSLLPNVQWHPQNPTHTRDYDFAPPMLARCRGRARYYLIDLGISSRFDADSPGPRLVVGTIGRDQTAPELSETVPYDPFKLDVYLLGNYYATRYIAEYTNLDFLKPVVEAMTRRSPQERPTIDEAYDQLRAILRKRSGLSFRWRLKGPKEQKTYKNVMDTLCFIRELYYWSRIPFRGMRELRFGRPQ